MSQGLKFRKKWLRHSAPVTGEAAATLCQFRIDLAGKNVSEYVDDHGQTEEHLEVPVYFVAEWIAQNWWPLLWEPRKSEEVANDEDYDLRHGIAAAQNGFALPNLKFVPTGKNIFVGARARVVPFADVKFRNSAGATLPRSQVESELRGFVESVAKRVTECGLRETELHDAWELVQGTADDEEQFCQLAGALGVSPYAIGEETASVIESAVDNFGYRVTLDLCLASSPDNLQKAARGAEFAKTALQNSPEISLEPLSTIPVPPDNFDVDAYRRGVAAAKRVRSKLKISDTDPHGADKLFDLLKIDPGIRIAQTTNGLEENPISGIAQRHDLNARIGLLQAKLAQRRFAAARAAFAAWATDGDLQNEARLLTQAGTRDQQANRAFAAEITAPIAYIRSQTKAKGKPSHLSHDRISEIAAVLNIEPGVVRKQAVNNYMTLQPSY